MKKILLGFTAFTLILTGCQKSEVVENINDGNNQLDFGVYQGKATRAGELTNNELNSIGVNFPIYAYKRKKDGEKSLYFKEVLTYESTGTPAVEKWNTSIPRFLTAKDPLQFYAYYAKGTADGNVPGVTDASFLSPLAGDAYPTFKYDVEDTQDKQVDLVAATVEDHSGTSVTIPFRHILSQINFGVKGYYGAQIEISNIQINDVNSQGVFSFIPDLDTCWSGLAEPKHYQYTFPAFKTPGGVESQGKWTNPNNEEGIRYIFGDGGGWGPGKGDDIWYVTGVNTAAKFANATGKLENSLMLMPQPLTAGMSAAYVTFDYTIQDLAGSYIIGETATPAKGKFDLNMDNKILAYADEWKPNLRYLYIIDFTGYLDGQLLSFTVDVETNQWENYDKPGEGIVLLSSVGEPMFKDHIQGLLPNAGTYAIPVGHVFSDIAWDWSPYTMKETFATDDKFTVTFTNVKFNGNSITVTAPKGFEVSNNDALYGDSAVVTLPGQTTLTFKKVTLP